MHMRKLILFIFLLPALQSCSKESNPVAPETDNSTGVCAGYFLANWGDDYRCLPNLNQLDCAEYEASINYGTNTYTGSFDWYLDMDCSDWCLTIPNDEVCDIIG